MVKTRFQIRDETFGLALYEAESASEALLDFVADHARGEVRPSVVAREDGSAELVYAGIRYSAVPADAEVADRAEAWAGRYVNESDAEPTDEELERVFDPCVGTCKPALYPAVREAIYRWRDENGRLSRLGEA